jgi:hypothetical protein
MKVGIKQITAILWLERSGIYSIKGLINKNPKEIAKEEYVLPPKGGSIAYFCQDPWS